MKLLRKQMLLCSILFLVFTLSACSAIGQTDENNLTDSATSAEKTVSVVRGTITPTVSTQTTIVPAVPFIIFSPENGIFNTAVELEEKITAGQIIGTVNGKELKSPVDGTITSIAPSNESVPSNYPVAIVHYTGFALNVEADNFLSTLPEYAELKAKFQVYDGVGPTDMIAVVSPAADENAFTGIVPQEGILQCLISQTVDVKSGQSATVVITATTRNDVLILPLSVIAGRQGTGLVTVITPNGERVETTNTDPSIAIMPTSIETLVRILLSGDRRRSLSIIFSTSYPPSIHFKNRITGICNIRIVRNQQQHNSIFFYDAVQQFHNLRSRLFIQRSRRLIT